MTRHQVRLKHSPLHPTSLEKEARRKCTQSIRKVFGYHDPRSKLSYLILLYGADIPPSWSSNTFNIFRWLLVLRFRE